MTKHNSIYQIYVGLNITLFFYRLFVLQYHFLLCPSNSNSWPVDFSLFFSLAL